MTAREDRQQRVMRASRLFIAMWGQLSLHCIDRRVDMTSTGGSHEDFSHGGDPRLVEHETGGPGDGRGRVVAEGPIAPPWPENVGEVMAPLWNMDLRRLPDLQERGEEHYTVEVEPDVEGRVIWRVRLEDDGR